MQSSRLSTLASDMESVAMVIRVAWQLLRFRKASMKSPNMNDPLMKQSMRMPVVILRSRAIASALS